jgi:hypothetical protein
MSIAISNGHARATVLSAVWSPTDQQLVAVLMAATDKTVLKALKAELEKNNKNSGVVLSGNSKAELSGARRGYIQLSASLEKFNAQGHVMALLHWRDHDPRAVTASKPAGKEKDIPLMESEYFYAVSRTGDCNRSSRSRQALCSAFTIAHARFTRASALRSAAFIACVSRIMPASILDSCA